MKIRHQKRVKDLLCPVKVAPDAIRSALPPGRLTSTVLTLSTDCDFSCDRDCIISCQGGYYYTSGNCLECPVGFYCSGEGTSAPRKCPPGTHNYFTGKADVKACLPCSPGSISTEEGAACRPCPAGTSCDPGSGELRTCPQGQHSPEGVLHCLPCTRGFVCPDGHVKKSCPPGQEPNPSQSHCIDCPEGHFSSAGSDKCQLCPTGSYCPHKATPWPLPCPPGYDTDCPGQKECKSCNGTSHCKGAMLNPWEGGGRVRSTAAVGAVSCRPGTYRNNEESPDCLLCPLGYYCPWGTAVRCPAGTYGAKEGLQRERDCSVCPAGFHCLEGSPRRPGSEFLCPRGYYCEPGTSEPHISPCPPGTFGEHFGQTSVAGCKRCAEGQFCPEGAADPGWPCARGKFCPAGTVKEMNCPGGTYTRQQGAASLNECLKCPAGFYCPEGTSDPLPCPRGTFNPLQGQDDAMDCRLCYAGKACSQMALPQPDVDCMEGFTCPPGSSRPNALENACPPGTFSNLNNLTDRSQCGLCPPRHACVRGTGGIQRPPVPCFAGHYCPRGTMFPTQHKCAAGTWSDRTNLVSASECSLCPRGWYCLTGAGLPSGRCSSGHYCPEGTQFGSQFPCPAGTYSTRMGNGQKDDCRVCPEGSYCTEGSAKPTPCPVATYRRVKGGKAAEDCTPCPAGYHCPRFATIKPRACGTGSYSDHGSALCLPCLPGHYCSNETTSQEAMLSLMVCPAGLICTEGLDREPQRATTLCPKGYYCPGGDIDPNPRPCPNGTYSDRQGLREVSDCTPCPAGQHCYSESQGISRPTGSCPSGYHCPVGTGYPYSFPCTPGSYRNSSLGHRGEMCQPCPAGFYCTSEATEIPTVCPRGYFCVEGSSSPEPCEEGTYSARPALGAGSECAPCVGGWYCAGTGLTEPTGSCEAGFYCRERARSATPADGHTGGLCPIGSYCPAGSAFPLPCPPGTFSNATGLSRPGLCVDCTPGYHCSGSNISAPAGLCSPGYYCTGGASAPNQHETQEGHYTLPGAFTPEPCALGTFQPARGQSSCLECLRGQFCNQTGLVRPFPCPPGHYCLPGTIAPTPCPAGSYTAQEGAGDTGQCVLCDPGQFCSMAGLSAPVGPCKPGYYCTGGTNSSMPVNMPFGDLCPAGFFCPSGTRHPFENPCPPGTWNNGQGAWNQTSCWLCPPGHYCHGTGLTQPSALCAPGFYCSGGAKSSMPVDGVSGDRCPKGHYCPEGSVLPLSCPDGSYANITGVAECLDCPAGYYCLSGQSVQLCPEGHYCPGGTGLDLLPCPPGTYSPEPGNSQLEQCQLCPAGMYCEDWGLSVPTGSCQAGYFCLAGMNFRNPDGNISTGVGGPCPQGHYCPAGTSLPVPCPRGTFSSRLHVVEESGCSACPPGVFCGSEGLSQPAGPCREGFHCTGGAQSPLGSEGAGGPCPVSHYCPVGNAQPLPCPAGTYNNLTGQAKCFQCGAGYYCPEKTSTYSDFPCPPGFYCPDGTRYATQFPCPRGYYNPEPMTQSLDSCLPCPPGHYCEKERLTAVSGTCKAGWFCVSAAWNSQPFDLDNYTNANCLCPATATGGKCQEGYYCPAGSSEPIPCPPGAYCNGSGLSRPSGSCSAGYYCSGGASQPNPTDKLTGNRCPPGSFCGFGSGDPQPCLPGTFSRVQGLVSESECLPCTEGFYCETAGLVTPSGPCRQGYFCPPGQRVSTGFACPVGHYCPEGSPAPVICESGSYQNLDNQAACKPCEEGYYCDNNLGPVQDPSQYPCPQGHYCPQGTRFATQYGCPVGTFNPRMRVQDVSGCLPCPPGKYCSAIGLAEPTGDCLAGFWCKQGAQTRVPSDGLSGGTCSPGHDCPSGQAGPCPVGHFCPRGTATPQPCPVGTFSNLTKQTSEDGCIPCLPGHFCGSAGLTAPTGECWEGFYCSQGATVPNSPIRDGRGGPCPTGHFCPKASAAPQPCPGGTYCAVEGQASCSPCVEGYYCPVSSSSYAGTECAPGHYCPTGTSSWNQFPCPAGTYNPFSRGASVQDCIPCDPGLHCASPGLPRASGQCAAGHYCVGGALTPHPSNGITGDLCPRGHYCSEGSAVPQPCPPGHYSNTTKNTALSDCLPCPQGLHGQVQPKYTPYGFVNRQQRCAAQF